MREKGSPFVGEQAKRGLSLVTVLGDHALVERPLPLLPAVTFLAVCSWLRRSGCASRQRGIPRLWTHRKTYGIVDHVADWLSSISTARSCCRRWYGTGAALLTGCLQWRRQQMNQLVVR